MGGTLGVNSVKKQFVPRVKRSCGSVVDHTLVFQSRDHKIDAPSPRSFG